MSKKQRTPKSAMEKTRNGLLVGAIATSAGAVALEIFTCGLATPFVASAAVTTWSAYFGAATAAAAQKDAASSETSGI